MFKGCVLSESLSNPVILNKFNTKKVIVECPPEYEGEPKIWHDFVLEISKDKIFDVCDAISKEIKEGWYAHFWDDYNLYVVLPDRIFKMPREDGDWKSPDYLKCKKYAMEHGIEEQYISNFLLDI